MKILLLGKDGQLGLALQKHLTVLGDVIALGRYPFASYYGDLENIDGLIATIRLLNPDIIVNAAAYTNVDKAESEIQQALKVNAVAPAVLAEETKRIGALLIHYSSDYVFDGSGDKPWQENDKSYPINAYGQSKLEGDQAIMTIDSSFFIFRSSWIYGKGKNFINTIISLAKERETIRIIDDQIGVPTATEFLARMTVTAIQKYCLNKELKGLYHLVPEGETNWYDFAKKIIHIATDLNVIFKLKQIEPIKSDEYVSLAKRPLNSRLSTKKFQQDFEVSIYSWEKDVQLYLQSKF